MFTKISDRCRQSWLSRDANVKSIIGLAARPGEAMNRIMWTMEVLTLIDITLTKGAVLNAIICFGD